MSEDFKLDKTAFSKGTFEQASHQLAYWKSQPLSKRLEAAWILTCRAYGIDPLNPPKMDKTYFRMRKHAC